MSVSLNGWHPGERSIHDRLSLSQPMAMAYTWIDPYMPEQHRVFHSRNLHFIPLTTLDSEGRPWSSLVSGPSGSPGFIASPKETELHMTLEPTLGDPIVDNLDSIERDGKILIAGLGIEFSTRRRNKFAGSVYEIRKAGELARNIKIHVNQAIGNCPKYINIRQLESHPDVHPQIAHRRLYMNPEERLPDVVVDFILQSDTVFLGTTYKARKEDSDRFPSHVGMNQRGGRQGYIRVTPSDGRTVILPDYSGNRLMTSLGNIEATPLASMSFVDFSTGDILYLTGTARNFVGVEAQKIMPRQNVLTAMYVNGFIFVRDALRVRQIPGDSVGRSPYSPPIKYLAEERINDVDLEDVSALLTSIEIHSPDIATLTFETSAPVAIQPGQAAALDFTDLLGKQDYAHMAPGNENRINDDRIRTWTISSAHVAGETKSFRLTMRQKPGGLVTGALFNLARHAAAKMPDVLRDARPLGFKIRLVGVGGEFNLPKGPKAENKYLWMAGGIGVTPFISMLSALSAGPEGTAVDIIMTLSTREPEVLLTLLRNALPCVNATNALKIALHLFTDQHYALPDFPGNIAVHHHSGRIQQTTVEEIVQDVRDRAVYLCGSPAFEDAALDSLRVAGAEIGTVKREGFGY